jgi:hypothetical protein
MCQGDIIAVIMKMRMDKDRDISILYTAYTKLFNFLKNLLEDKKVIKIDSKKNAVYVGYVSLIEEKLSRLENLNLNLFIPFDSLYSEPLLVDEGDIEWQYTIRPKMHSSIEQIEKILPKNATGIRTEDLINEIKEAIKNSSPIFTVSVSEEGIISINNFKLSKPHYDSPNDRAFNYIYKNQNRTIIRKELSGAIKLWPGP